MINRRKLLVAFGAGVLTAPFGSFAQPQGKVWRVGFLSQSGRPDTHLKSFQDGMRDLGYVEGKNLAIVSRFEDGTADSRFSLATELINLKMDALVVSGTPATRVAQQATTTIPIIMASVGDPIGAGLIRSLARPGGNVTGLSNINIETGPKRLEMLIAMVPKLLRVAILVNPENANAMLLAQNIDDAAQKTVVKLLRVDAGTPQQINNAFVTMAQEKAGAVIVAQDSFLIRQRHQIAELALKNRLASISGYAEFAEVGGLMSYGQSLADNYRRAAAYVDKIFKGAKPADLPVEQPTKFELIINGKTAKALGITIPQSLRISADKVIE